MAFKKTLAHRLFKSHKFTSVPSLTTSCVTAISSVGPPGPVPDILAPDPGDDGIFRRYLHRLPMQKSVASSPELRSLPTGEELIKKLRRMDEDRNALRIGRFLPHPRIRDWDSGSEEGKVTVADVRKVLRLSQLETVKRRLSQIEKSCILWSEFVQICVEVCSDADQGLEFAKRLDESGTVISMGNVVFIKPDQVIKAMQGIMRMPLSHPNDTGMMKELQKMEEQKAAIDKKAESLVRRELWAGLGYLVIQSAVFMRLTFWELTWDVMEPICYYVTSMYCVACYAFFLRTSIEPSFSGFFQSRFSAKQKRLMKLRGFDHQRYDELRRACYPHDSSFDSGSNGVHKTTQIQDIHEQRPLLR